MFKRCLAIVLLISLIATSFQSYFVYAGFELNKDYIAQNLCVNRNRPWMNCNGSCYFMNKLKAAEEKEKKQADKDNLSRLEVSFFQQSSTIDLALPLRNFLPATDLPVYQCFYTYSYSSSLLQPPQARV